MQVNVHISSSYFYIVIFILSLLLIICISDFKYKFLTTFLIILFICLILAIINNDFIFKNLIKNHFLKIKDTYTIESNFEIENKDGFNYIIEVNNNIRILNNKRVNLIYDLDENKKPYYETIIYDAIIFKITVINVHLNKN